MKNNKAKFIFLFLTILIVLTMLFMAGMWSVDIGASAMIVGVGEIEGYSFSRTPSQHYHLGLMMIAVSFFILISFLIFNVVYTNFKGDINEENSFVNNNNNAL